MRRWRNESVLFPTSCFSALCPAASPPPPPSLLHTQHSHAQLFHTQHSHIQLFHARAHNIFCPTHNSFTHTTFTHSSSVRPPLLWSIFGSSSFRPFFSLALSGFARFGLGVLVLVFSPFSFLLLRSLSRVPVR